MSNPQIVCPECGVYNEINDTKCWKCKKPISEEERHKSKDSFLNGLSETERAEFMEKKTNKTSSQENAVKENMGLQDVIVTDIKMPFGSMVVFMVKWAIASIPALIILIILFAIITAILGGLGASRY